jgi:hypothetical protein
MNIQTSVSHWDDLAQTEGFGRFYKQFPATTEFKKYREEEFAISDSYKKCIRQLRLPSHEQPEKLAILYNVDFNFRAFQQKLKKIKQHKVISLTKLMALASLKNYLGCLLFPLSPLDACNTLDMIKATSGCEITRKQLKKTLKECENYFKQFDDQSLLKAIDKKSILEIMGRKRVFIEYLKACPNLEQKPLCVIMDGNQKAQAIRVNEFAPKKMIFWSKQGCYSLIRSKDTLLCSNNFKQVYKGNILKKGEEDQTVAILTSLPTETIDPECCQKYSWRTQHLWDEFLNLSKVEKTNRVVKPHDFFWLTLEDQFFGFLIEEYSEHGNLKYCLNDHLNRSIYQSKMMDIMDSVINAVYGIFQYGYFHGDLKLENIVVQQDSPLRVKLIDLEAMIPNNRQRDADFRVCMTALYADPYYLKVLLKTRSKIKDKKLDYQHISSEEQKIRGKCNKYINEKSEVWSLGLVLYHIRTQIDLTGNFVRSKVPPKQMESITSNDIRKVICGISKQTIDLYFPKPLDPTHKLIRSMLALKQNDRPTISQVKAKWDKLQARGL